MAYTTIDDPSAYFQTLTYRGDASATTSTARNLTNEGYSDLQPDLIWGKNRDSAATGSPKVFDSTRGAGTGKGLSTDIYNATGYNENLYGWVSAFNSDGFSVLAGSSLSYYWDIGGGGGDRYVAWQWKANGGTTSAVAESGSGDGGINACTYQANTTAGFSIIKFTGHRGAGIGDNNHTNVTHGLNTAPTFVMIKAIDQALSWVVMGKNIFTPGYAGFNNFHLKLEDTSNRDGGDYVCSEVPDSNYVYVGNENVVNQDGQEFIMYAWHEVQGYSKFGTYEGTADADGPFIYTGFKPAWILLKNQDNAGFNWAIIDNKRTPYNGEGVSEWIWPDDNSAEFTDTQSGIDMDLDMLSNGFKITTSRDELNLASTFMYMAFAENPFVTSTGIPATAR